MLNVKHGKIKSLILYHNVDIKGRILLKVARYYPHKGSQCMNISKKNLIPLIIIGVLVSGIPVITLCSSYCVSSNPDLDSSMDGSCPFLFHSFVQIVIVMSALFILPFAGRFVARERQFIPPGVYWPLFRPPRYPH